VIFKNREDAGKKLAAALKGRPAGDGVVLAVPRGGVVVGAQVARELDLPLDLIIPRKIGVPGNQEVAIGAVAQDGTAIFDEKLLKILSLSQLDLQDDIIRQVEEICRRMKNYRGKEDYPSYSGKRIIIVDDGVATGYTILAAIRSCKKMFRHKKLILAVPVAPPDTIEMLKKEADEVICLFAPADFYAVGQFYLDFTQTSDEEVVRLFKELSNIH